MDVTRKRNRAERFWDMLAKSHDNLSDRGKEVYSRSIDISRKYLNSTDRVMDLGCGSGLICIEIAADVEKVVATDISTKVLDIAAKKAENQNITNIDFLHTRMEAYPFEEESFDAIMAFNIIHLVDDTEQTIERVSKLLKPGGYFISSTVFREDKGMNLMNMILALLMKLRILPKIKLPKYTDLQKMLDNNGLKIIETTIMSESKLPNRLIITQKN